MIPWILVIVMAILSILLFIGKGTFLIAGFNTASSEQKSRYNVKRLGRVMGCGLGSLTAIVGLMLAYSGQLPTPIKWLMPWGYLVALVVTIILANTVCLKK